jgi:tripartite-type tricarboxylate transporter receptor subunit TctC
MNFSKRNTLKTLAALGTAAVAPLAATPAWAQAWPTRQIRLIVPFAPGGATDIIARIVADPLAAVLGRPIVVDNRGGAGGVIGATELVRAANDGYTLGMATVSTTAANPAINPRIPYNPLTDKAPIINIAATPNVIAVHPSFPARDYAAFLAELRRHPGRHSYASSGTGGNNHLLMEAFKSLTRTFVTHIPYRGSGPALQDTVAGQVPMIFDNLPSSMPFIRDGRLIPIIIAAPQRLPILPNVPTFAEVGLAPVNRMAFYGIIAPRGTPRPIIDRVNAATRQVLQDPAVRRRIDDTGSLIVANSPEEFAEQIRAELAVFRDVVTRQRLTLE